MQTLQVESWSDFIAEAEPLLPLHWEELALDKDKVPLEPCYEVYAARERMGELLVVTVREEAKLIGYFLGFIAPGLHYRSCLTLTMDIFYVLPEYRGQNTGWKLFKEVEQQAKLRGVKRMFVGSKNHKAVEFLFLKLGYTCVETYYSHWLGD